MTRVVALVLLACLLLAGAGVAVAQLVRDDEPEIPLPGPASITRE